MFYYDDVYYSDDPLSYSDPYYDFALGFSFYESPVDVAYDDYYDSYYAFDPVIDWSSPLSPTYNLLVDDAFYLRTYPDVAAAGIDPDVHYATWGWLEGRDPNAFFSTDGYLSANIDVDLAGIDPLDHYASVGWQEGRDPSVGFDNELYLQTNPDVAAAGINPLEHYLVFGRAEGREIYATIGPDIAPNAFDFEYYLLGNPDVGFFGPPNPLTHYNSNGWQEGRDPSAYFDTSDYLQAYRDVAAAGINPLDHFDTYGWREGRDPSIWFDTKAYLAANPDVAAAGINPLTHFLQFGVYEGRLPLGDGILA
ncbi:hypothetical protein [Microvirga calopogonii]|uniref:hypothetical protein n=1 Tax=Microvirga calopogonii TaxID=2078013 RepID=UPI000E0D0076|nr:hypothetical protein [Microvirga calopogonii]